MNHYEVLRVEPDASPERVREAYLLEARRHHPDFHTGEDASRRAGHARQMQAVNEAWAVVQTWIRALAVWRLQKRI